MSSTPNPLTRIEREAKEYAALFKYGSEYRQPAYSDGALAQMNRAAPVVKALFAALGILELKQIEPEMAEEFRKILQTYKADV